ncbi:MAG: 1-acyl-sn-glycerol-3-phosphate acyltransferase [Desulfovibrio sp.]|nr:1-acyl-sn-glycerol-3-phosphate acyltransferase [Desulfovibrio sp.]
MMPEFVEGEFLSKFSVQGTYSTKQFRHAPPLFPTLKFYTRLICGPFIWLCRRAAKGMCDDAAWTYGSVWLDDILESLGCRIIVEGLEILADNDTPCVFVANHMSALETFMLPGIIRPYRKVTFVLKKSLVELPWFGAVVRSRDPIVVGRLNPREDLSTVLNEGKKRLENGISVIVFPQSTRTQTFDPKRFNSIGEKLAKRAGVPIIPIALKTDTWKQGKRIKELGRINPQVPIHYRFGKTFEISGTGKEVHEAICAFIAASLDEWRNETKQ